MNREADRMGLLNFLEEMSGLLARGMGAVVFAFALCSTCLRVSSTSASPRVQLSKA